ncbi:response regulator [Nocardioides sp.]|uniref:response regulator n=1 Tax=Nocardioides sp. TaxID=35761 RepID=UPI003517D308
MSEQMTTGGPFLVVDDDTVSRLVLASTLRKLGFEVAVAEDVASARTMLDAEEYAAVFTDYEMPDGTGLDLIAHADASGSAVPFVLITGVVEHVDSVRAQHARIRAVARKPMGTRQVQECLAQLEAGPAST